MTPQEDFEAWFFNLPMIKDAYLAGRASVEKERDEYKARCSRHINRIKNSVTKNMYNEVIKERDELAKALLQAHEQSEGEGYEQAIETAKRIMEGKE